LTPDRTEDLLRKIRLRIDDATALMKQGSRRATRRYIRLRERERRLLQRLSPPAAFVGAGAACEWGEAASPYPHGRQPR
jgi:hypothetical protein